MSDVDTLRRMIAEARTIVAFTGAGISTESGIPDFRSRRGNFPETLRFFITLLVSKLVDSGSIPEYADGYAQWRRAKGGAFSAAVGSLLRQLAEMNKAQGK